MLLATKVASDILIFAQGHSYVPVDLSAIQNIGLCETI